MVEIEMVLNSRPLVPVYGSTDDIDILTPSHFLVDGPLVAHTQPIDPTIKLDYLTYWRLVRAMRNRFWVRWSREYLNMLQQRYQWSRPRGDLAVGDIVMIIDPSLLTGLGRWPLGRILETYPGLDQRVRVVKLKTAEGSYIRPITKLVRLPVLESRAETVQTIL